MAQARAYSNGFYASFGSIEGMVASHPHIGCFCMVLCGYDPDPNESHDGTIIIPAGFRLVECIMFTNWTMYLTLIAGTGDPERVLRVTNPLLPRGIDRIGVALICTDDEPYRSMLDKAIDHYRGVMPAIEICVGYFGENPPDKRGVYTAVCSGERFDMAFARNASIGLCQGSHVLIADLDCLFSFDNMMQIISAYTGVPHNGVLALKHPASPFPGNTLTFGDVDKVRANGFNERFKQFWYEDTEYLMNYSRIGIVPWTVFVPFDYSDHSRASTLGKSPNQELFRSILLGGGREHGVQG